VTESKVDLAAALATFTERWSPRIVARYNDNKVFLAKAKGDFVWHSHPDTDDLFLVLEGRLTIEPEGTPNTGDPATAAPEMEL
jgi:mannose-6-phosphate isomerase-like protein (cupin superfamily)